VSAIPSHPLSSANATWDPTPSGTPKAGRVRPMPARTAVRTSDARS